MSAFEDRVREVLNELCILYHFDLSECYYIVDDVKIKVLGIEFSNGPCRLEFTYKDKVLRCSIFDCSKDLVREFIMEEVGRFK